MLSQAVAGPARVPTHAAQTIQRPRLTTWLERRRGATLRALIAPSGFGKSTLLREYAGAFPQCRLIGIGRPRRVSDRFTMVLAERLGLAPDDGLNVESAVAALARLGDIEIAIDDVDHLPASDAASLAELVAHAPPNVRLIVAARSRAAVAEPRRLLDGATAVLDAHDLAFTSEEITELCALLAVDAQPQHVCALVRESEGWPLVAADAVRCAAHAGDTLADAMRVWLAQRGSTLREMVLSDASDSELGASLVRLCTSETLISAEDLQALEREGLYVRRTLDGALDLLRAVRSAFVPQGERLDVASLPDVAPMFVQLLGEFEVRIGGRRVEWVRRKDAMLFKYLLLEPLGRVSRAELRERFWPAHDADQAAQNLRTTCSNIRAALRRCLPESRVDLYFRSEGRDIVLRTDLAMTDLERFERAVDAARHAMETQQLDRAAEAYEAARAVYRGPLIVDPPNDRHVEIARAVDERFNEVQRHLTALRRLGADAVPAHSVVA